MKRSFFLFLLVFLAGCACFGDDKLATTQSRLCAIQCSHTQGACLSQCTDDARGCMKAMQLTAYEAYEKYARERGAAHAPLTLVPSAFEKPEVCQIRQCEDSCETRHDICYDGCKGMDTDRSVLVF